MSQRQDRTDRILIVIALLILFMAGGAFYFDGWMWGGRLNRGERIGMISTKSGDVRVKFEGDLKWGRAARGQDLNYNDAIYAGAGSQANLTLGQSDMTVSENTLIVLRREQDVSFLNLNYGSLFGKVAKHEKIMIDTGSGKPIEFKSTSNAQIILSKKNGKTELKVLSGQAEVTVGGQKRMVDNTSKVVIDDQIVKPVIEKARLIAKTPLKDWITYSDKREDIPFSWTWANNRPVGPADTFTLEFATEPSFTKIHAKKVVVGRTTGVMSVSKTLSLFYRVRGPRGELSQIERVNFVRIKSPFIVRPLAEQRIPTPVGQNALVEFEFSQSAKTDLTYEIAADREFKQILLSQRTAQIRQVQELSVGTYFARARAHFGEDRFSEWSPVVPFMIEPKLEPLQLTDVPERTKVLIPNRAYPAGLYVASPARVREFLSKRGFLHNFFPFRPGSFDQVLIGVEGQATPLAQTNTSWPQAYLAPGSYKYTYQLAKSGFRASPVSAPKHMDIAMEPPRALGTANLQAPLEDGSREAEWSFTPLLFAKFYDVEVSRQPSFRDVKQIRVEAVAGRAPLAQATLAPGEHFWRARARDGQGRLISDFSATEKIQVPDLIPQALAKEEKPAEREPAATETSVAHLEKEKERDFTRNGWWAWLGSGANYVDYRQSVQGRGTITSTGPKVAGEYVEAGYNGAGWGGVVTYKSTPGEIVVDNAQIDNGAYTWSSLSLEGIMRRKGTVPVAQVPFEYGLRVGLQQHKTPFVFLDANNKLQLKQNEMKTASFGVLAEMERRRWTYYWLMRYQYPFMSKAEGSNQFEIDPTFAFDGSIGTSYNLTKQLKVGLFWYGQWHQYNFVYGDGNVTNAGFQSLFYSNVDLRLGFDF